MADVMWIGAAQATPEVDTIVIGSHTAAQTFQAIINGKTVTYIAQASDTTNAILAASFAALLAACTEPEFQELTFVASSANVLVTGPSDGAPFTLTVGGTGTISTSTTTAPVSPSDIGNGANYSTGALPGAASRLVLQEGSVPMKYNAGALTNAITFARYASYTGSVGLPDVNPAGYREYRQTHLDINATASYCQQTSGDQAGQFRLNCTSASAHTATVVGDGTSNIPQVGSEVLELTGTIAASVINSTNGSITVAPNAGQTAVITTVRGINSTITLGVGCTLNSGSTPTISLTNCNVAINTTYTTISMNNGQTTTYGAAAGTTTTVDGGVLVWKSTGSFGTLEIGGGGTFDMSSAPASVAAGGTIKVNAGGSLFDPAGRITAGYAVQLYRCDVPEVSLQLGPGRTLTVN